MIETFRLIEQAKEAVDEGYKVAMATVVAVEGSAYRHEGAKLIIFDERPPLGLISGGCLEGEVAAIAREVFREGQVQRESFDLREDEIFGLGSGCGGVIDIVIEELGLNNVFEFWSTAVIARLPVVRVLIISSERQDVGLGEDLIIVDGEVPVGSLVDPILKKFAMKTAEDLLSQRNPETKSVNINGVEMLLDVTLPPPEFTLFGAGLDAQPVANLARRCGFQVTVVDPRQDFLSQDRLPGATLIQIHPVAYQEQLNFGCNTAVVIMNHHYERDRHALRFALQSRAPYVGVLGPSHRFHKLLEELKGQGFVPTKEQLDKVYNPIGLAIGAEGPEEIAVSVVSEVLAFLRGKKGGMLRKAFE